MLRSASNSLVPASVLLLVVTAGYGAGRLLDRTGCHVFVQLACLAGVAFAMSAWFHRPPIAGERLAAVGLIVYLVIAIAFDSILYVGDVQELIVAIIWLFPLVVGGVVLPRWGAWLVAEGYWAVLFGGVTAVAFNVSHVDGGVGLLATWVE